MSIYGAIFDNQVPTAKQMGAVFKPLYADGILNGCNVTYSGSNAVIAAGMIMACGRPFELTAATNVALSGTGYARVIINVDMSKAATAENFAQVYFSTETVASQGSFKTLTQNDVNSGGTLYQCELARFTINSGSITGKVSQLGEVGISAGFCKFLTSNYYGTSLPAAGNKGRIFFKKVT